MNDGTTFKVSQCTTSWTILKAESRYMWVGASSWAQPKHYACDTNDILVCTWYQTWIILSACNVGASVAGTGKVSNGMYFQFGRNKWFYYSSWATYSGLLISPEVWKDASKDPYKFINFLYDTEWLSWHDWVKNDNWWYKDGFEYEKQWPCANWYHIPTFNEFNTVFKYNTWIFSVFPKFWIITWMINWQSLPNNHLYYVNNPIGSYWIINQANENESSLKQYAMNVRYDNQIEMVNYESGNGLSVRCFKNEKIQVSLLEFKEAFQEYFDVDSNNYFKKFWKIYQLVPVIEQPKLLENNIWMFQDYKERLKNEVIFKKWWKYFYSNGWYYFIRKK